MDMSNSNDANITSPFEGISKYSMEQIIKCIDHYLETRVDTFITGHTSKDFPVDRYQWEVEENGVTGRIWVRLDEKDKTKKNIGYGLNKGVKKQDNTVQLTAIYLGCIHAVINLSNKDRMD